MSWHPLAEELAERVRQTSTGEPGERWRMALARIPQHVLAPVIYELGVGETWQVKATRTRGICSAAHAEWTAACRPGSSRLGLTVTDDERRVWVDRPSWSMPWNI